MCTQECKKEISYVPLVHIVQVWRNMASLIEESNRSSASRVFPTCDGAHRGMGRSYSPWSALLAQAVVSWFHPAAL